MTSEIVIGALQMLFVINILCGLAVGGYGLYNLTRELLRGED